MDQQGQTGSAEAVGVGRPPRAGGFVLGGRRVNSNSNRTTTKPKIELEAAVSLSFLASCQWLLPNKRTKGSNSASSAQPWCLHLVPENTLMSGSSLTAWPSNNSVYSSLSCLCFSPSLSLTIFDVIISKNSWKSIVPDPSLSMSLIIFLISSFLGSNPSARIATFSSFASMVPGGENIRLVLLLFGAIAVVVSVLSQRERASVGSQCNATALRHKWAKT